MSIIQRRERREEGQEQQQQQAEQYSMVRLWEARERETDPYPCPITAATQGLLRQVGLLKFYEEATSLKSHSLFLRHLIRRCNAQRQAFRVGINQWYTATEEDVYFITGLSRRGVDFPSFPEVPAGCVVGSQLVYSQRYIGAHLVSPTDFQVAGGQLCISAFGREEVQCLSLIILTILHNTSDGKIISCSLLYYVDYLVKKPRLFKWSVIFLQQFCTTLDRCRAHAQGRVNFPFS